MHKALILAPESAEEALATVRRMAELCEAQSELCRALSRELDLSGEIPIAELKKLARLQIESTTLRKSLRAMTAVDRH